MKERNFVLAIGGKAKVGTANLVPGREAEKKWVGYILVELRELLS